VLALAAPLLLVHGDHLPSFSVEASGTSVTITLSDLAVLAVVVTAAIVLRRDGVEALRPGRPIWIAGAALLVWIGFSTLWPALTEDGYRAGDHVVSALKFAEYALLAPAVPLLLRDSRGLRLLLFTLMAWSALAAAVGVAQFLGADIFGADTWANGGRQPSFLGHHDLAALAAVALSVTVAAILLPTPRHPRLRAWVGGAGGWLSLVVSGAVTATAGLLAGALAAIGLARRAGRLSTARVIVVALICLTSAAGVVALRGGDLIAFATFLGAERVEQERNVETYSHRTLLAYLGGRIYLDHPLLGAGWQASNEARVFSPYLDDARRRFPSLADEAFPGPGREYGVQNVYVQLLADMGPVGLLAFVAVLLSTLALAVRTAGRASAEWRQVATATAMLVVALAGTWVAQGLWAGLPLDALTWLVAGLAAAAAYQSGRDARRG
jgi:hypothetical protein